MTYDRLSIKLGLTVAVVKKPYVMPKVAEKRKKVNRAFGKMTKATRDQEKECLVNSPVCTKVATTLHHLQKRGVKNLVAKENLLPVCASCNGYIESNSAWAKKNGFTISRFKK